MEKIDETHYRKFLRPKLNEMSNLVKFAYVKVQKFPP